MSSIYRVNVTGIKQIRTISIELHLWTCLYNNIIINKMNLNVIFPYFLKTYCYDYDPCAKTPQPAAAADQPYDTLLYVLGPTQLPRT